MNIFDGLSEKGEGATESEILQAEKVSGLKFPAGYRELISESNGYFFQQQDVGILSLKESLEYLQGLREFGMTELWGYFPILDNNDSNPWCVCCKEPIEGYIVQYCHDDSAKIKFRDVKTLFAAIQASSRNDALLMDKLAGDFESEFRTPQDIKVARELLKAGSTMVDLARGDACRFAMWLFGEDQVDEIVPLLNAGDHLIADDATLRLASMENPKALEALRADRRTFEEFVRKALEILHHAGIKAETHSRGIDYMLNLGNLRLDLKVFYADRNKPDFEKKFIERVKFLAAQKR
jgi:hypothetical protein